MSMINFVSYFPSDEHINSLPKKNFYHCVMCVIGRYTMQEEFIRYSEKNLANIDLKHIKISMKYLTLYYLNLFRN